MTPELPIPPHFDPDKLAEIWRVPYQHLAAEARQWAAVNDLRPAYQDASKICLLAVDVQNTFCIPGFELYVGGRSGHGAVDDNKRLCEFIYRNLATITKIVATLDTHQAMQIFHCLFFVNDQGEHPAPYTLITLEDVIQGRWRFNPALSDSLQLSPEQGQRHLEHYTRQLQRSGKYQLTVWPYHGMLGGIGHALVAAVEEAIFFHTLSRHSQADLRIKGNHPLTEHYSVLGPEVATGVDGLPLPHTNDNIHQILGTYDAVIIAGQAKSHCVAWTVADMLTKTLAEDGKLAEKIYLLEDCTSAVVVPGVVDYTDAADDAFRQFADQGAHLVRSTAPMATWPGLQGL